MSSDHLTIPRPASSLSSSSRPISRASQRPASRFSQYSTTRQTRVTPRLKVLIKQVTGLDEEHNADDFQDALAIAVKRIDRLMQHVLADTSRVDAQIDGHVEKARINVQNVLADTLRKTYSKLREYKDPSLSTVTTSTTISAIVEFLLHLSSAPDASTLAYASFIPQRNDSSQSHSELTWAKILGEEPFEGQHWQGAYGLPPSSTVETWDSEGSETDLSTGESDEYEFDTPFAVSEEFDKGSHRQVSNTSSHTSLSLRNEALLNRIVTESLSDLQYWNKASSRPLWDSHFDFNRPWTLGPASDKIFKNSFALEEDATFMKELDVIREVLFLLQGLPSILFKDDADIIKAEAQWRIPHLTQSAQTSILNVFATLATIMKPLRSFETVSKLNSSPTFEAFMAGIAYQLQQFDIWCSNIENQITTKALPPTDSMIEVVSLLQLQYQVEKRTSHIFHDLLNVMRTWQSRPTISRLPSQLINLLWQCLRERQVLRDEVTAQALWEVLRTTAGPLWLNLGRWLKDGIPIDLGLEEGESKVTPTWNVEEMFIRINPLIDTAAPDFWEAKYTLKRIPAHAENTEDPIPLFLSHFASDILAAGKAVGLIRAMGLYHFLEPDWIKSWDPFEIVTSGIPSLEVDFHLREKLSEILTVSCQQAQATLSRVLIHEIHLWKHLQNLETICLTTKGDLMDQFAEQLFSKMDSSRFVWHDYHFMNAAFRSIAKTYQLFNPSLVTFSYKAVRDRKLGRTVEDIEGLTVEYAVPFPLIYLFGLESSMCYSQIFCFLLQIRRSKFVLDQISLNKVNVQFSKQRPFLITFYLIRWKLSWFINALYSFIKMHVIDVAIRELHESLFAATSLDEMIDLHQMYLERLLHRLFLQENASSLHRAILSILDLSLRLNDCLISHKTSEKDFVRSSVLFKSSLSRRSLRPNHQKSDVIGFVESLQENLTDGDESEEDEDNLEETGLNDIELINDENNVLEQLEYISSGMVKLIDFVRREVQILASGVTDVSDTFGILAFLLEEA